MFSEEQFRISRRLAARADAGDIQLLAGGRVSRSAQHVTRHDYKGRGRRRSLFDECPPCLRSALIGCRWICVCHRTSRPIHIINTPIKRHWSIAPCPGISSVKDIRTWRSVRGDAGSKLASGLEQGSLRPGGLGVPDSGGGKPHERYLRGRTSMGNSRQASLRHGLSFPPGTEVWRHVAGLGSELTRQIHPPPSRPRVSSRQVPCRPSRIIQGTRSSALSCHGGGATHLPLLLDGALRLPDPRSVEREELPSRRGYPCEFTAKAGAQHNRSDAKRSACAKDGGTAKRRSMPSRIVSRSRS